MEESLTKLQRIVRDRSAFEDLQSYNAICFDFLQYIEMAHPTRIVSPTRTNYIFYQYSESHSHKITRPLNTNLFIASASEFHEAFERFIAFLSDLKIYGSIPDRGASRKYAESNEINQVIYTMQQSIGSIGDSFENANQSRKIIGQLFETLIKLVIKEVVVECG